jgi:biotin-dependent carboxylase-like uncharacterized protein
VLEVVDPGLLLTLQDRGRPGFAHLGVPPSGACDPWGLAVANVLAGASPEGTVAEATYAGAELLAVETCAVALSGADLGAERDDGRHLALDAVHRVPAGARIRLAGRPRAPFGGPVSGIRGYLGLAGGIVAARSLGSSSTLLAGGLGGVGGRALRAGDRLEPVHRGDLSAVGHAWPGRTAPHPARRSGPIRFVPGPDGRHLPPGTVEALAQAAWFVAPDSDRMGLRLAGTTLPAGTEILSHPLVPGAIQVPADGHPIVMLVDGPTLGGYPVVGVVPRAELPRLGQARPGDRIELAPQDPDDARRAWRAQRQAITEVAAALRSDAVWHRVADEARG